MLQVMVVHRGRRMMENRALVVFGGSAEPSGGQFLKMGRIDGRRGLVDHRRTVVRGSTQPDGGLTVDVVEIARGETLVKALLLLLHEHALGRQPTRGSDIDGRIKTTATQRHSSPFA